MEQVSAALLSGAPEERQVSVARRLLEHREQPASQVWLEELRPQEASP